MELKRYVLDTQRCFIYDMQNKDDVKKFEMISKFATHFVNGACKTSDNILDLVEVGDLVKGTQYIWVGEVMDINDTEIETFMHLHWKSEITDIYKKQPNGDYKRYEVQK